jgi:hypothetical protein
MMDTSADKKTEVEVTPEMIEAGLNEFLDFDSRYESDYRELVASIYEAMEGVRVTARRAAG